MKVYKLLSYYGLQKKPHPKKSLATAGIFDDLGDAFNYVKDGLTPVAKSMFSEFLGAAKVIGQNALLASKFFAM